MANIATSFMLCLALIFSSVLNMSGVHGLTTVVVYVLLAVIVGMKVWRREIGSADNVLFWVVIVLMLTIVVTDAALYRYWDDFEWGYLRIADVKAFVTRLVVNVAVPFGVTGIVLDSKWTIRCAMKWVPVLFVMYVAAALLRLDYGMMNWNVRLSLDAASGWTFNSIQISRIALIGFSVSMAAWMESERENRWRWALMGVTILAAVVIVISGQRASILAMGVVMLLYTIFRFKRAEWRRLAGMWAACIIAITIVLSLDLFGIGERFGWLIEGKYLYRLNDYGTSWNLFTANNMCPYGTFGYWHMAGRCYPHNMILEGMVEYGLPGLILTTAIFALGGYYVIKLLMEKRIDGWLAGVPLMWSALGLSAMVSSNILYNGLFFMTTGFLAALYQNEKIGRE